MAFQLTQLVPPRHDSLAIIAPPNPSNPPTALDVCNGAVYTRQVMEEYSRKKGIPPPEVVAETLLFQVGLVTAFDIGRQPVPAPAPAGAVPAPAAPAANGPVIPLGGQAVAAALLNSHTQIMATLAQIQADLTGVRTTQGDMQTTQANIQADLTNVRTTQATMRGDLNVVRTTQATMRGDLNVVRTAQATMRGDLNVVRTTQANMQTNQTGMQTTLADVRTSQRGMERTLADVQTTLAEHGATLDDHGTKLGLLTRICAQSSNRLRGPGTSIAFCIVPFLDDSLPTVPIPDPNGGPQPVRPALPAILNVHAIRSMSGANLRLYIQGYYGPDQNVPHMLQARRALVADAVGCTVEL